MFDEKPMIGPLNWYHAVVKSDFAQELRLQKIVPFHSNLQISVGLVSLMPNPQGFCLKALDEMILFMNKGLAFVDFYSFLF